MQQDFGLEKVRLVLITSQSSLCAQPLEAGRPSSVHRENSVLQAFLRVVSLSPWGWLSASLAASITDSSLLKP